MERISLTGNSNTDDMIILELDLKSIFDVYYEIPYLRDDIERLLPQIIDKLSSEETICIKYFIADCLKKNNLVLSRIALETYDIMFSQYDIMKLTHFIEFDNEISVKAYIELTEIMGNRGIFTIAEEFEKKLISTYEEYESKNKRLMYFRWLKSFEIIFNIVIVKDILPSFVSRLIDLWEDHKCEIIGYNTEISRINQIVENYKNLCLH